MSRGYGVHLCSFTTLDDLKPKERSDPMRVLEALREVKRFSVWDMDDRRLVSSVAALVRAGRIRTNNKTYGYPWIAVEILDPAPLAPQGTQR